MSILSSFSLSSLLGLLLLDLKIFDTGWLVGVVLAASVCIGFLRPWIPPSGGAACVESSDIPAKTRLMLVAVLAAAALFYFQPADTSLLSSDAGIYLSAGVQIAQGGTLAFNEELVRGLPERLKDLFFRVYGQTSDYHRFPGGFILQDPLNGRTVVSFQPLFPLWTAVFVSLFGLKGAFYLSPQLGVMSCLVFYLLALKILRHSGLAFFALSILAFSPVQIWFARYTMPEIMLQFLILGGLYTRFLYEDGDTFSGFLSAILFGTALAAKFHAFIIVLFIILFCLFSILRGREKKDEPYFFIPLAVLVFLNILHLFLYPNDYPPHLIIFLREVFSGKGSLSLLVSMIILAAVIGTLALLRKRATAFTLQTKRGFAVLLAVLGLYGLWIAPYAWNPLRLIPGFEPGYNSGNLARLAWYITPAGVVLALIGCLILLQKDREISRGMKFFLWLALSYTIFFLFKGDPISQHYWNARKYVPFILPACACLMAVALDWIRSLIPKRLYGGILVLLFGCCLAGSLIYSGRSLMTHREGEGAIDQLRRMGKRFGDRPFILVQSKAEGWLLAPALTYLLNKPAVALPNRAFSEFDVYALHQWANETGRTLYYLAPDSSALTEKISHAMNRFTPEGEFKLRIPVMERTSAHLPRAQVTLALSLGIYKIGRPGETRNEIFIDMGRNDFAHAARGFYAPERIEKRLSRHSNGHGTVYMASQAPGDYILSAFLTGGSLPENSRMARVYYNRRFVKRVLLEDHFKSFHIPIKIHEKDKYCYYDSMEIPVPEEQGVQWRLYPQEAGSYLEIAEDVFMEGYGALKVVSENYQRRITVLGDLIPIEGGSLLTAGIKTMTRNCTKAELTLSFFDPDGNMIGVISADRLEKMSRRNWSASRCSGRAPERAAFLRPKLQVIGMRPPGAEALFDCLTIETDKPFTGLLDTRIDFVSSAFRPEGRDDRLLGMGIDWLKLKKSKIRHTPVQSRRDPSGKTAR